MVRLVSPVFKEARPSFHSLFPGKLAWAARRFQVLTEF